MVNEIREQNQFLSAIARAAAVWGASVSRPSDSMFHCPSPVYRWWTSVVAVMAVAAQEHTPDAGAAKDRQTNGVETVYEPASGSVNLDCCPGSAPQESPESCFPGDLQGTGS